MLHCSFSNFINSQRPFQKAVGFGNVKDICPGCLQFIYQRCVLKCDEKKRASWWSHQHTVITDFNEGFYINFSS